MCRATSAWFVWATRLTASWMFTLPRGLIQNPALRHPVAQGGACGRVSHRGQRSVIGAGLGVLLGVPAFSGAVAPFPRGAEDGHAARRRRWFCGRAARGGVRDYLQVGVRASILM